MGRYILKDDEEQESRDIDYLQGAEWVAEPNGTALKASGKKGLVK